MKIVFNVLKIVFGCLLGTASILTLKEQLNDNTTSGELIGILIGFSIFMVLIYLLVSNGLDGLKKTKDNKTES